MHKQPKNQTSEHKQADLHDELPVARHLVLRAAHAHHAPQRAVVGGEPRRKVLGQIAQALAEWRRVGAEADEDESQEDLQPHRLRAGVGAWKDPWVCNRAVARRASCCMQKK